MRLESVWFHAPDGPHPEAWYGRHARVLEYSARKNSPGWTVNVQKIGTPRPRTVARRGGSTAGYVYNTWKLEHWLLAVENAAEGELMLLIDADTMVLRPLDAIQDIPFDVAITEKRGITRLPLNGGVLFLRVNARSRAFMRAYWDWNLRLLGNSVLHNRYWATYAGMNQAALGALLENGGGELAHVAEIPCREWNLESATWETFSTENPPRIVHVKGAMRRGLMHPEKNPLNTTSRRAIGDVWLRLEKEALAHA